MRKCVEALQFFMNVVKSQLVLTACLVLIIGYFMIITGLGRLKEQQAQLKWAPHANNNRVINTQ